MKKKTLLWVVDCQNDFINQDGKLYVPKAEEIKKDLQKTIKAHENLGGSVVYTQDWHYYDSEELSNNPDFVNTFPEHCMAGTFGADLIKEVKPNGYNVIVNWDQKMKSYNYQEPFKILLRKDRFDFILGNPNSELLLDDLKEIFTTVNVMGVVSEICVKYAIDNLLKHGFQVNLIEKCIKSLNQDEYMKQLVKWEKNKNFKKI